MKPSVPKKKKLSRLIRTDDRLVGSREWPEARIVAEPVKDASEPIILVERNIPTLRSLYGDDLFYLPGEPVISTFTGAGGFDLGTEGAGLCTVVQHEQCQFACQTLIANRPRYFRHAALIQGDIYKTPTSMILEAAGLRVGEAFLVTGGPPCQGFSFSGKRNPRDRRNDLIFEFLRVVSESQAKYFCMENVPGMLSLDSGRYFKTFLRRAYECYYELVYGLLDAASYGVPQHRVRFFCMGTRRDVAEIDGLLASLPQAEYFGKEDLKLILGPDGKKARRCERAPQSPGIRYFPDREVLTPPTPTVGIDVGYTEKYLQFYERLAREERDRLVIPEVEEEPELEEVSD